MIYPGARQVVEIVNPVTGRLVRLVPAFDIPDRDAEAAVRELTERFEAWCTAGWAFARLDPEEVDISGLVPPEERVVKVTDMEVLGPVMMLPNGRTLMRIRDRSTGGVFELPGTWEVAR